MLPIIVGTMAGTHACSTPITKGDSESHFLAECVATCADGLQCVCGVCTRTCSASSDCTAIDPRAECGAELEPACASLGKTCDVACIADDACASLGQGYVCVGGRCRGAVVRNDASAGGQQGAGGVDAGTGGANAAGGSGGAGGQGGSDGCAHTTYPPVPGSPIDGGVLPSGDFEIVAAQYNADLGDSMPNSASEPTRYRSIGLDLDGLCTTSDTLHKAECLLPSYAMGVLDGAGGIDNAFGTFVQFMRDRIPNFSSDVYTQAIHQYTSDVIVLRVTGYNGHSNDDVVRVDMFAGGFSGGSDVFSIWTESVVADDPTRPKVFDPKAYVTGGKLVASLPRAEYRLQFSLTSTYDLNLALPLSGATLLCDIAPTNIGTWGFTLAGCTLAGRVKADDLLHQLSAFQDPLTPVSKPKHLCADSLAYGTIKNSVCAATDTYSGIPGATTPCDSLSIGIAFDAKPAELGNVVTTNHRTYCPPATDPANDSCASLLRDGGGSPPFAYPPDASTPDGAL